MTTPPTTPPPNDNLARLLSETFASREPLADPAVAQDIAAAAMASPVVRRRRTTYLAAAASVVLVLGGVTYAVSHEGGRPGGSSPSQSPPTHPATYAANRAAAAAESARVLGLVMLPNGATRLPGRPTGWPNDSFGFPSPSNLDLTQTGWWSVPVDASTVRHYLLTHHPVGLSQSQGAGGSAYGLQYIDYDEASADPAAYPGVTLQVTWFQVGDRTLVRADTYTAARLIRTPATYVTGNVSAVDVERIVMGAANHRAKSLPTVHLTPPSDSHAIGTLVRAINALPASVDVAGGASCPGLDPNPSLSLVFHTTSGIVRAYLNTVCPQLVQISRDGKLLSPSLEPDRLATVVDRVLGTPGQ